MISDLVRALIIFRFKIAKYAYTYPFEWDEKTGKLTVTKSPYILWNHDLILFTFMWFPVIMSFHFISKFLDEDHSEPLVSFILAAAESVFVALICAMAIRLKRIDHSCFTEWVNQTLFLNAHVLENFPRTEEKEKFPGEPIAFFVVSASIIIPIIFFFCMIHDLEPTHILIRDLFEVDIRLEARCSAFFVLGSVVAFAASNVVLLFILPGLGFIILMRSCVSRMVPLSASKSGSCITTKGFQVLDRAQVISLYRALQILLTILNHLCKKMYASFHFPAMMVIIVGISYASIEVPQLMFGQGVVMALMALVATVLPLLLVFFECYIFGGIVEKSKELIDTGKKLVSRKTELHKFLQSCHPLYVDLGYPFFHVSKETFPEFFNQALDFLITLLMGY